MDIIFRLAQPADAPRILEIYRPYVEDMAVSFEYEAPSLAAFEARMEGIMRVYPYIVAEEAGRVMGFAYATRHAERKAYDWSANLSVYLDAAVISKGLGKRLYNGLIALLRLQNVQNVFGLIVGSNERSLAFHERLGFQRVGLYRNMGYKLGEWHSVSVYQLPIGGYPNPPQPLLPLPRLDAAGVEAILQQM